MSNGPNFTDPNEQDRALRGKAGKEVFDALTDQRAKVRQWANGKLTLKTEVPGATFSHIASGLDKIIVTIDGRRYCMGIIDQELNQIEAEAQGLDWSATNPPRKRAFVLGEVPRINKQTGDFAPTPAHELYNYDQEITGDSPPPTITVNQPLFDNGGPVTAVEVELAHPLDYLGDDYAPARGLASNLPPISSTSQKESPFDRSERFFEAAASIARGKLAGYSSGSGQNGIAYRAN